MEAANSNELTTVEVAGNEKIANLPKMPKLMKTVYEQIFKHPKYKDLTSEHFAVQVAYSGLSYCTAANNKYVRQVWKHLYLGEPIPKY